MSRGRRRRRRRGKRGGRGIKSGRGDKGTVAVKILQSNIRGFNSKKESFKDIVKNTNPDVIILNETALRGSNKAKIDGYFTFQKNRATKAMGGVATLIENHLKSNTVKVAEGEDNDEYIITRIDKCKPALNIVNIYGEQEGRTGRGDVLESWTRLRKELDRIKMKGEFCIMLGDFNKKVGNDELGVRGNHPEITYGGELVRELIASEEYFIVNNSDVARGGPFTRIDPADENRKSCLDLVIASHNLMPFIQEMVVDKERTFTPMRVIATRKGLQVRYTDHLSIEVYICDLPSSKQKVETKTKWNLMKPGGWNKYVEATNDIAAKIVEIVDEESDIEKAMKKIEKLQDKAKFVAFGKTKITHRKTENKHALKNNDTINAQELIARQSEQIEKEILEIKQSERGRTSKVFKMKAKISGSKNTPQDANSVKDPESGELLVAPEEIKAAMKWKKGLRSWLD